MSKYVKKITKPISKVLDKIVPNEIKPALPYLAAFAPFMLGPAAGMGGGQGLGALFRRAMLTGALPNIGAQLAQEGNEGELNPLSVLMASASAGLSGAGAGEALRGQTTLGGLDPALGSSAQADILAKRSLFSKAADGGLGFLAKGADALGGLNTAAKADPFSMAGLKAAAMPVSQATGDLAYAEGTRALKEFNAAEAANIVAQAAAKAGMDQEYIDAITSSMGDYGYDQEDINEILRIRGLFASGGRVGLMNGGEPDFISMREVVENVGNDEMMEGIMSSEQAFNMGGSVLPQGMEMDYRQGGMIPMGSKERADDVPARVSKNEFVMTADAVRAAGGGSVNKGAQKMYQLMNNLEART